ncbi:ACP S-malonyltransferase [Corynebacterium variabile]|uniref:ACP S-malonyltransferase n=1 Tax=Corynebacterium variabile TaxID=1727 RepID=UPI0028976629|nr:ACP S-malonyltransferase [Corynebacterium variabile]
MTTVLLFGGQGSQRPGMLHRWESAPEVVDRVAEASEVLGEDVWELDSSDALRGTRAVQLSLLVLHSGVAAALANRGLVPDIGAGHSLGAWSAAVAAGVLSFGDAVRLVDIRASTMADAAPRGYGMAAVTGLSESAVRRVVDQIDGDAWVSNLNTRLQCTVSGSEEALEQLRTLAAEAGAQRVVRLAVAVPAHSPLTTPARMALEDAVAGTTRARPIFPLVANRSGRLLRRADDVLDDLVISTDRPVRWASGIAAAAERGVDCWIQCAPGSSLIGMLRDVDGGARSWCVDNVGLDESVARWRVTGQQAGG